MWFNDYLLSVLRSANNMTDKLQKLIDSVPFRPVGTFEKLMFVSAGKYDGLWGINGYDNLLILGGIGDNWYKISDYGDKFDIYKTGVGFNLDIPTEYGVPRIWFNKPVYIDNRLGISSVVGKLV